MRLLSVVVRPNCSGDIPLFNPHSVFFQKLSLTPLALFMTSLYLFKREVVEPCFRFTSEKSFSCRRFLPTFARNIWQVGGIIVVNQFAYKKLFQSSFAKPLRGR
jgi:hypothetical protein